MTLDDILPLLACPVDRSRLMQSADALVCVHGHRYAVVEGVPVLLRDDVRQTHWAATQSLEIARGEARPEQYATPAAGQIDGFVQDAIAATGGTMYRTLRRRLMAYPVPDPPLPPGEGRWLLDVGCNWGRWTIAAARHGYRCIGVDPSLEALLAAQRVCRQLGLDAAFVAGDARYLPFAGGRLDAVLSYSVIQHLSRPDVAQTFEEIGRVLVPGGSSLLQMPNACGLRAFQQQLRRGFREPREFQVRYWTPRALIALGEGAIGPTSLSADGFFSINAQASEAPQLPWRFRALVAMSVRLVGLSRRFPALIAVADSLWVASRRAGVQDGAGYGPTRSMN